ncbi:hypothetical protein GGP41_010206 [Bipolaris sorokiniana]|uniref:Exosome complex protein n=2 Tax=Cochliobolus sativus TaxID=45130 RepID=A0A8H6DXW4_COCSA|nr:uncharacterized protein COCSADRAFT_35361 [Bipolaris sorokiniana ND90Pr]EMD65293.1 hypothetical protein COCSADRAFT_35361 [Bipolaris sorokiniana ND90Pr]KAF5850575.1 hypothetical protein GGP41_010206 [Bipolaris sorokiniana]
MDPQIDLPDLVEDLEVDIDELTTALEPLLSKPLSTTASSLPLLDKAKLYCLAAYAIESLLFASLTASGVNATEHAIFKEIARLRQYNSKIKEIEDRGIKGSAEGRARLDVAAAGRFIKHGLLGNDKYDLERQERMAKERARAHLKAQQINKKFDNEGKEVQKGQNVTPKKRGAEEKEEEDEEDEQVLEGLEEEPAVKKARVQDGTEADIPQPRKRGRPSKKDRKAEEAQTRTTRKRNTRLANQDAEENQEEEGQAEEEGEDDDEVADQAPKTRSETFTALLDGSLSEKHKQKKAKGRGGKKNGKGRGK